MNSSTSNANAYVNVPRHKQTDDDDNSVKTIGSSMSSKSSIHTLKNEKKRQEEKISKLRSKVASTRSLVKSKLLPEDLLKVEEEYTKVHNLDATLSTFVSGPFSESSTDSSLERTLHLYESVHDENVRCLDVPLARYIREVEEETIQKGNENRGFLSFRNGFLPMLYPEHSLPDTHILWDELGANLNTMVSDLTLRPYIENELPLLSAKQEDLEDRFLFRAALILGLASHAYWYCGPNEPTELPSSLKEPWDIVNSRLGRKGSYLSGEDVQLYNFSYKDNISVISGETFDAQEGQFQIANLNMLQSMWGNKAEIVFHLAFCEMARAAAPLLSLMCLAQDAVQRSDDEAMFHVLHDIGECIQNIQVAFMKIIPDPNADTGIEPLVWAKTVAPVGVSFNKGMPSPSGLGTPFFHCLDVFFSRGLYASTLGKDAVGARSFFPETWIGALNSIASTSIHVYVASSDNEELHTAWSHAIDTYASWNGLLGKHLQKTYNFLELAFKTGREKTLGGFKGGFADRMWDKIMDMLDRSREERLAAKNSTLKLPLASLQKAQGEGNMKSLVYELPHDAFDWKPGDTVSVWPSNSDEIVSNTLECFNASGDEMIPLSEEWRKHLKKFLQLGMKRGKKPMQAKLRDILRFASLSPLPKETFMQFTRYCPDVAYHINPDSFFDVPELLGYIRFIRGQDALGLDRDGDIPDLLLKDDPIMYYNFLKSDNEDPPLAHAVARMLMVMGVKDIPIFNNPVVSLEIFEEKVYPILTSLAAKRCNVLDMLRPIKQRQYSIANAKDEKKMVLKLVVANLTYERYAVQKYFKSIKTTMDSERAIALASKYFNKWKSKALNNRTMIRSNSVVRYFANDLMGKREKKTMKGVTSNYLTDMTNSDLMFSIETNVSFHAPSSSQPIIMIAAGSGISPFLGYLEQRIADHSPAPILLIWSIPYLKEGKYILKEIEEKLRSSSLDIEVIVSVTRENSWPVFSDGQFEMKSHPKERITDLMMRKIQLRKKIHRMLHPEKFGGSNGYCYLCGSASFIHSTLDVIDDILMDFSLFDDGDNLEAFMNEKMQQTSKKWLTKYLQSDQRIVYEAFNDKPPKTLPFITISELTTKNVIETVESEGLYMAIYDKVYDVASFVHPGGTRILQSYYGMDATTAWEAVRHHRSQGLNAKLATLLIGKLKMPSFSPIPLLILDGEKTTNMDGVFKSWCSLLFSVVEVENTMTMEYSLDALHVAGKIHDEVISPMKLQMMFQAHRRMVFSHLNSVWTSAVNKAMKYTRAVINIQYTTGGESPDKHTTEVSQNSSDSFGNNYSICHYLPVPFEKNKDDINCFHEDFERMLASPKVAKMLSNCDALVSACHEIKDNHGNEDTELVWYLTYCIKTIKTNDMKLLREWKNILRRVMIFFEENDGTAISLYNCFHELLNALRSMLSSLEKYVDLNSSQQFLDQLNNMPSLVQKVESYYDNEWLRVKEKKGAATHSWQNTHKSS